MSSCYIQWRQSLIYLRSVLKCTPIDPSELWQVCMSFLTRCVQSLTSNRCGFGRTLLLRKQDADGKQSRRLLQEQLNTRAVSVYTHIQEAGARILASDLLHHPDNFRKSIRRFVLFLFLSMSLESKIISMVTSVILMIAYGYKVKKEDDPLVQWLNR